jgi:hypothetical protein
MSSVTATVLGNQGDPGVNPGTFYTADVTGVLVGWFANGHDMSNFLVTEVSVVNGITSITISASGSNYEYFSPGYSYTFSSSRATVPSQIVLSKSKPSQLTPLCANGKIQIWWNAPSSNGGLRLSSYSITVLDVTYSPPRQVQNYDLDSTYNTYVISGLTNGTNYSISVAAGNDNGFGPAAYYRTVQPGIKPQPPTDVTAVTTVYGNPFNTATVLVTWVPPVSDDPDVGTIRNYVIEAIPTGLATGPPSSLVKVRFQAAGTATQIDLSKRMASEVYNPKGPLYDPYLSESKYKYNVYTVTDAGYSIPGGPINGFPPVQG